MPDDQRHTVLRAALAGASREGFTPAMVARVLNEEGAPADLFTPSSLVSFWSHTVNDAMAARLAEGDLAAMKIRTRLRTAVLTRLAVLAPHKDAARRATAFLALPQHALLATELLGEIAGAMWLAAGDHAADFSWYTKRASLGAVYAATEIAWFGDESLDMAATTAFLDARIANVLQFEKWKAQLRASIGLTG